MYFIIGVLIKKYCTVFKYYCLDIVQMACILVLMNKM